MCGRMLARLVAAFVLTGLTRAASVDPELTIHAQCAAAPTESEPRDDVDIASSRLAQLACTGMMGRPGSRLRLNDVTVIDCHRAQPISDGQDLDGISSASLFDHGVSPPLMLPPSVNDQPSLEHLLQQIFSIARGLRKAKQMCLSCPTYL